MRTTALLGLSIGDAMGFPTEFNDIAQIAAKCGPWRTMPLPVFSSCSAEVCGPIWVEGSSGMPTRIADVRSATRCTKRS